nr:hypothetical protein B0A51_06936 [Rachicladosporium sp. CCFEE 5018]
MSTAPSPSATSATFGDLLNGNSGAALQAENITWGALIGAIGISFASFGAQTFAFVLLRWRLSRIYRPRTYLVPERERVAPPPHGVIAWLKPIFATPSLQFIQKSGLDAYFFLRYLRMLLKIFVPLALLLLPILLPINRFSGGDTESKGISILSISNVAPEHTGHRLWAHLFLAITVVIYVCYVIFKELRGYIRVRQAYLTSPQHRIRASATTVLVTGIPKKWLTTEALDGLYDVFPGGIRNIWINRNFDELADKISLRDKFAKSLEDAETNLIKLCRTKYLKKMKKEGASKERLEEARELTSMGNDNMKVGMDGKLKEKPGDEATTDGRPPVPSKNSDEVPLRDSSETAVDSSAIDNSADLKANPDQKVSGSKWAEKLQFWKKDKKEEVKQVYPEALSPEFDDDKDEDALWRTYIAAKDRETMRLPIVDQTWFPSLPLMGKQVDRIYYLRREVARLNLEIQADQNNVEKYPFMNSAFIQFNHQVAAHMACQAVSHHVPNHMSPRTVEISPNDVLWDNMSIKWWERYIRFSIVVAISVGLVIFYAIPVTFSSLLANISVISTQVPWLGFLTTWPTAAKSIVSGVLPPAIVQIVLVLVPIIYRFLVKLQGVSTGSARETGVQGWYFVFLFIQIFLVVSISGGLLSFFSKAASDPLGVASNLAQTMPKAANYFFSYLTIQGLSNSASALLQVGTLFGWFVLGPLLDSTPRAKWRRQTTLPEVKWGSFFPPFTNFAVIGIIYSVIAPLIMFFMIIIFGLYWIVYRYNVLYVYRFREDTGGVLFPQAVNQLFTGLYIMEVCLAGFFFLARDQNQNASCVPQGIIIIIVGLFTVIYHFMLNQTFAPLLRYLPITLEDDAVIRDEEFARAQASKFDSAAQEDEDSSAPGIEHQLEDRERAETAQDEAATRKEVEDIARRRSHPGLTSNASHDSYHNPQTPSRDSWHRNAGHNTPDQPPAQSSWIKSDRWRQAAKDTGAGVLELTEPVVKPALKVTGMAEDLVEQTMRDANRRVEARLAEANGLQAAVSRGADNDIEAQKTVADVLFAGYADELEDLTPDERDLLVRYAFQHSALRARKPVIWLPKDALGISDDEIRRGKAVSKHLEMSNEGTGLDRKGRATFEKSPPDFSNVDLIAL